MSWTPAGASTFHDWFAMQRGGQPAVWAAGVSTWSPAKAAYMFAEELPTHSTQYRTAVLEVNANAKTLT